MLKIMLIDDEYLVLKGVESMLNHQQLFSARVSPFLDPVEAMEQLGSIRPDAVVLDINMPELNGLNFIERALAQGFRGSFIIISGYEDTAFLKRAFELHVADYILKPIDKQRLLSSLMNIDEERRKTDHTLLLNLHQHLRHVNPSGPTAFERHEWEHLLPQDYLCLISVRHTCPPEEAQQITSRMEQYFQPVHFLHDHTGDVFLCSMPQPLGKADILAIALECGIGQAMLPGISPAHPSGDVIDQLMEGRECFLLLEAVADAIIGEIGIAGLIPDVGMISFDIARPMMRSAEPFDTEELIYHQLTSGESLQRSFALCFVQETAALLIRYGYLPGPGHLQQLYQVIWKESADLIALWKHLQGIPAQYLRLEAMNRHVSSHYSDKVTAAIHFICRNYPEDISLNDVAESVGMSPSYFSATFHREVGVSFVSYLKNLRLEKACSLLLTCPYLSVEAIAARVGFQTVGQFYKVFKAEYHVSPRVWKENKSSL